MAVYTWRCVKCNAEVNVTRPMADSSVPPDCCPTPGCQNTNPTAFNKLIGAGYGGFSLKGDGWHRNLYTKTRSIT